MLKALEPYDLFFFEEPLPYTDPHAYAELRESTTVRVAGGESLATVEEFARFAEAGSFDVAQPDAAWLSLTDFVEVGRMFGQVASHAWGAGGAVMQNVHAAFATPNAIIIEMPPAAGPLHTEVWGDSLRMVDGMVLPPEAPGLGVALSDGLKEQYPFVPGAEEFVSVPGKRMSR
jgi:galactonate dehydratase